MVLPQPSCFLPTVPFRASIRCPELYVMQTNQTMLSAGQCCPEKWAICMDRVCHTAGSSAGAGPRRRVPWERHDEGLGIEDTHPHCWMEGAGKSLVCVLVLLCLHTGGCILLGVHIVTLLRPMILLVLHNFPNLTWVFTSTSYLAHISQVLCLGQKFRDPPPASPKSAAPPSLPSAAPPAYVPPPVAGQPGVQLPLRMVSQ